MFVIWWNLPCVLGVVNCNAEEDMLHCLRDCEHSYRIWKHFHSAKLYGFMQYMNVAVWLKELMASDLSILFLAII